MKNYNLIFLLSIVLFGCKEQSDATELEDITIYTIGDSTMADKNNPEENPEYGWAQVLEQYFNDNITVDNRAKGGRSSRSFITENRWKSVLDSLQKGDYVFIQFGHNDQKIKDPNRYTNPHTAYRNNLITYISETREKGAIPILLTSIVRRNFNEYGVLVDTHGQYPLETRLVAQEYEVPLIDLQYQTELLEDSYGVEESKKLHLHYGPGEHPYYPNGRTDNTHLSLKGANEISKIVIAEIRSIRLPLTAYIKQ
ncbi:MAG: rhamnogalacturonan acetylesterase [Flavobacteriaceae bacterium]|nr:MAG: rhamnogalacturonan acetylesterase [Flavobacteriaceae bacterium]